MSDASDDRPEPPEGPVAATDGHPDELAGRRGKRASSVSERQHEPDGFDPDGDDEPQLFPLGSVDGDDVTLKGLIKAGQDVTATVSLASAEIPATSGLMNPNEIVDLIVSARPSPITAIPKFDGELASPDSRVEAWKLRQTLKPVHVKRIKSLPDLVRDTFAAIVETDPAGAARLHKENEQALAEALSTA